MEELWNQGIGEQRRIREGMTQNLSSILFESISELVWTERLR